jgi:hypothetical protein
MYVDKEGSDDSENDKFFASGICLYLQHNIIIAVKKYL